MWENMTLGIGFKKKKRLFVVKKDHDAKMFKVFQCK